ncbi:MAG: hypothetical protein JSW43_03285 [Gemmatimonadota bacterium]|nr:MAG: hypothetical protein JSW43_03285 [Gemmatimonadota bacterium]
MRRLLRLALPLGVILSLSCDSGPKDGEVVVALDTPSQDLGAIAFTLNALGPEVIDTVTAACGGCRVDLRRRSAKQVDGVVTGPLVSGALLRVAVSNRKLPQAYVAEALQAARRDYALVSVTTITLETRPQ